MTVVTNIIINPSFLSHSPCVSHSARLDAPSRGKKHEQARVVHGTKMKLKK